MDEHKAWLAGVFDRAAPSYDRVGEAYHEHFARRLVDLAALPDGCALLDVACGRGAVLLAAAGRAGELTGIDMSPAMIELAAAEPALAGADLRVMDAERLDFPDCCFDAVTAAFVLFFLPDPPSAAAQFHRVLRPGGRVAVSTWAEEDERWAWEDELLAAAGTPQRRALHRPFDRAEDVLDLLGTAGFTGLAAHREQTGIWFATEQDWWDWHWSFSLRGVLEQFDDAAIARLRDASFARMADLKTTRGYPMHLNAWIITGTRPH